MSVHAAVWCLWFAALAHPCAATQWGFTWPECSTTNPHPLLSKRTSNLYALRLYLDDCNITSLDPETFSYLPNLKTIHLNLNNISQLDLSLFVHVPNIQILFLSKNRLLGKKLPSQLFRNNRKLKHIDISYNDMNDAPFDLLQGLRELKILNLVHCSLRHIPLLVTQPELNSLLSLNLKDNRIQRIDDRDTFIRLENLGHLYLSNNSLEYLHEDIILKPLTNLDAVFLDHNRIKYIPNKLFHNHHLRTIDLGNNLIEYIPADAFLHSSLKNIYLNGNRLTYLPDTIYSAFLPWNNETKSFFFPNPWQCACLNEILVQLKRRNILYNSTLLDGKHPVCQLTDGPCIKNTRIALPYS